MKKLIIISILAFVTAFLMAQDVTINRNETYKVYTAVAGDTLTSTTKAIDVNIYLKNPEFDNTTSTNWYKYDISIDVDSSGDGTNATLYLQGSYDNSNWTTIESQLWHMTDSDTTVRFHNLASSKTITAAAHNIWAYDSLIYDDTLHVPAVISVEVANVISWPYLRVYIVGAGSGARAELSAIRMKFIKPENY